MSIYQIHPLVVGTKVFDKGMMTYQHDYGKPYAIPIYCWYLEGRGPKILVDTGEMGPIISEDRESRIGGKIHTFEDALAQFELTPEQIDIVIHTHLHNDHCENDCKCTNATFFVHRKELDHMHDPHPLDFRYNEDFITDVEENNQLHILDGDREIVPGIRVVHTPAHTEGGMSVEVATTRGNAIITGFCVIDENFNPPKEVLGRQMEVIPPGTHVNVYEAYGIIKKVKERADILLPLHEPRFASVKTIP